MPLNRIKRVLAAIAGLVRNDGAVTQPEEPTPGPTTVPVDPETARRDRVLGFLEANGGRVWQQDVVAELECSAASVSRVLCEMEADDEITRYWKQGQKVVALPAADQSSAGSTTREEKRKRAA